MIQKIKNSISINMKAIITIIAAFVLIFIFISFDKKPSEKVMFNFIEAFKVTQFGARDMIDSDAKKEAAQKSSIVTKSGNELIQIGDMLSFAGEDTITVVTKDEVQRLYDTNYNLNVTNIYDYSKGYKWIPTHVIIWLNALPAHVITKDDIYTLTHAENLPDIKQMQRLKVGNLLIKQNEKVWFIGINTNFYKIRDTNSRYVNDINFQVSNYIAKIEENYSNDYLTKQGEKQ